MKNKHDDGGPAFPRPGSVDPRSGTLPDGDTFLPEADGTTLRDYFAIHAAEADIKKHRVEGNPEDLEYYTREQARYFFADAMLRERLQQ